MGRPGSDHLIDFNKKLVNVILTEFKKKNKTFKNFLLFFKKDKKERKKFELCQEINYSFIDQKTQFK